MLADKGLEGLKGKDGLDVFKFYGGVADVQAFKRLFAVALAEGFHGVVLGVETVDRAQEIADGFLTLY